MIPVYVDQFSKKNWCVDYKSSGRHNLLRTDFSLRMALQFDPVSIMDQAIQDGIGKSRIRDARMPGINAVLSKKNAEARLPQLKKDLVDAQNELAKYIQGGSLISKSRVHFIKKRIANINSAIKKAKETSAFNFDSA